MTHSRYQRRPPARTTTPPKVQRVIQASTDLMTALAMLERGAEVTPAPKGMVTVRVPGEQVWATLPASVVEQAKAELRAQPDPAP